MTSGYDGFGATRFPVDGSITSAADLDPGKTAIMGLLKAAINGDCGDAWSALLSQLPAGHFLTASKTSTGEPVAVVSPIELTPAHMMQYQAAWPVLAVYREGEPESDEVTLHYDRLTQQWSVDYIIGPLDIEQQVKIGQFCVAVDRAIRVAIIRGWHPDFEGSKRQFFGQFSTIKVKSRQGPGIAQSLTEENGSGYYGMTVVLETTERSVYDEIADADEFETYTGYVAEGTGRQETLVGIDSTVDLEDISEDET